MSAIDEAVEAILGTYGDPLRVAADFTIDNADIQSAMAEAEQDSNVYYALTLLAKVNPPQPTKSKA
jgi:hypothetical protein